MNIFRRSSPPGGSRSRQIADELADTFEKAGPPSVELANVSVRFDANTVLDRVDLRIECGDWLALIGPNGAGKTTLVRALAGLQRHDGCIGVGDRDLTSLTPSARAGRLAVVPQTPIIPPGVSALDYVLLGRTPYQGLLRSVSEPDEAIALAILQRLDLDALAGRIVDTLSGGERQRVVIARALAQETDVLVLDEPTTALDIGHQFEVLELIEELRVERGLTVISTIHDLHLAGQFADRCALLAEGRIVAAGTPGEVLTTDNIGRYYGVDATVTITDDGQVDVAVQRRRRTNGAAASDPIPVRSISDGPATPTELAHQEPR